MMTTMKTAEKLADDAYPQGEVDWGSARQIAAENKFINFMEQHISEKESDKWEQYALKATTEEWIKYALDLLKKTKYYVRSVVLIEVMADSPKAAYDGFWQLKIDPDEHIETTVYNCEDYDKDGTLADPLYEGDKK